MMRGETAAAVLREKVGPPRWTRHLDRALVARLGRRPTVIPSVLGDRIRRRVEYFTVRTRSLAQALIDRVSPAGRETADMPVVHVGWRQPPWLPAPASSPASSAAGMAATSPPSVVRVRSVEVETVRHSRIAADAAPAFTQAHPKPPVVTLSPGASGAWAAGRAPGRGATSAALENRGGRDSRPPAAFVEPEAHGLQPAGASRDDEVVTLKVPPGQARTTPRLGPDHPAPTVDAGPPPAHGAGGDRAFSGPRGEAVRTLEMPPLRPAPVATVPVGGKAGADTAGMAPGAEPRSRSGAWPPASQGREQPVVATQWNRSRPAPGADGQEAPHLGAVRPSPPHGKRQPLDIAGTVRSRDAGEGGDRPPLTAPTPTLRQVVPVDRSRPEGAAGEERAAASGVSMDRMRTPVHAPEAHSEIVRQPVMPAGPHGSIANARRHEGLPFDAESALQSALPHAGQTRVASPDPASPLAASNGARGTEEHASKLTGVHASGSLHVPVLSANAGTPPERPRSSHSLHAPIDVAQLARRVERRIMKRLAVDAERRGGWS